MLIYSLSYGPKTRKEPIFSTELDSEMHEYFHRPIVTDTKHHSIIKYSLTMRNYFCKLLNAQTVTAKEDAFILLTSSRIKLIPESF